MALPEKTRLPDPEIATEACPLCGGTGWKPVEEGGPAGGGAGVRRVVRCTCVEAARPQQLFAAARIPSQYQHCDLANFTTSMYPEQHAYRQSLEHARLMARTFADEYPVNEERGLLFLGPSGVGKTHLAAAILRRLVERGFECLFCDYPTLLKQIQDSYNPVAEATEMQLLAPVINAQVLLLDDLGAMKPSAWVLDTVGYILNQRYSHKRTSLITTNFLDAYPPVAGASRAENRDILADRIGARIRSRLHEVCRKIEIHSEDFRERFKKADYQPLR